MSNHLSPASVSEHSSYAASSSNTGASPSYSHRSLATTMSSSSPSPSRVHSQDPEAADHDRPKPITCRWDNCGRIYYDPEVVYKHLCDDHVGRKSTNNLCLTCRWEGCDVSCAKRDHITSHLRVHTPLKPHSCDICNKTFKRPQDLKKHERIHTEQHQQQRQHKAAQNAAAKSFGAMAADSKASFAAYHLGPGVGAAPYGFGSVPGHSAMYHQVADSAYSAPAYPALPSQPMREHTPGYAQSTASLSPLSSRLDTPQGSSPAAQAHHSASRGAVSYLNFTGGPDARSKTTTDPNSYMFLAHGTGGSNLAGTKRNHEQVGEFFGDVRRKKLAPTYDATMAERLNQTFGNGGIDDASLQALLSSFETDASSMNLPQPQSQSQPTSTLHTPEAPLPTTSAQAPSKLALPDAMRPTDLAQLNAFLLQLGADAARDTSSASMSHASSSYSNATPAAPHNEFDVSSLSQYGLTTIPGFDESILYGGHNVVPPGYHQPLLPSTQMQRPIAQLPHRQQSAHHFGQGLYGGTVAGSYEGAYAAANQHGGAMYTHGPQQASFDSMRVSRGSAIVPQLAPMDMGGHSFRKVEALTRAAPGPVATAAELSPAPVTDVKVEERDVPDDEAMEDAAPSSPALVFHDRYRSLSPTASSEGGDAIERHGSTSPGLGLYPKLATGDALRRLPSLRSSTSPSSSLSSPRRGLSISSILSSESSERDSPPRRLPPIRHESGASSESPPSSSSSSLYPSLSERISGIQGLGRPPSRSSERAVPETIRQQHVRLIRQLLIAINFPDRTRAEEASSRITLAPILTGVARQGEGVLEDGEKTPSLRHRRTSPSPDRSESDASSGATPPGRSRLPTISQLLNDVDVDVDAVRQPRAMEDREMECDV
ncbi:uncharacterized protein PFL1_03305 [Pseudozyma flocculosa PF-1]|uniref:Related to Transcription factor pacC n=2 Tax=Pseudozyma flocculosa TaxID=84751 RepID=A0A5C3F9G1_9BASI|nr:uncharacterized protein PFL1_03305 [Pseudozyma flocculosa PF-1]EPQ29015.1 hypothetical protein PFL1_03305 [Pseudozyma flocculosa PF-1]SPO40009.1 related to Transcription factor pacC [Pseudozyma flocculosa]